MENSLGSSTHHTPFETVPNEPCNSSAILFEQQAEPSQIQEEPSTALGDEPDNRNLMSITKQMVDAYQNQEEGDIMSFYKTPTHQHLYVFCKCL